MMTPHGFGTAFGLPDPSQFVMKAEVHLRMPASNTASCAPPLARGRRQDPLSRRRRRDPTGQQPDPPPHRSKGQLRLRQGTGTRATGTRATGTRAEGHRVVGREDDGRPSLLADRDGALARSSELRQWPAPLLREGSSSIAARRRQLRSPGCSETSRGRWGKSLVRSMPPHWPSSRAPRARAPTVRSATASMRTPTSAPMCSEVWPADFRNSSLRISPTRIELEKPRSAMARGTHCLTGSLPCRQRNNVQYSNSGSTIGMPNGRMKNLDRKITHAHVSCTFSRSAFRSSRLSENVHAGIPADT